MSIGRAALIFLLFMVVLIWASVMGRYELRVINNQDGYAVAYRLDRWTGRMRLVDEDQWYPVEEGNPDDLHQDQDSPKNSVY